MSAVLDGMMRAWLRSARTWVRSVQAWVRRLLFALVHTLALGCFVDHGFIVKFVFVAADFGGFLVHVDGTLGRFAPLIDRLKLWFLYLLIGVGSVACGCRSRQFRPLVRS